MSSNVMMKNNKVSLEIETLGAQIKNIKGASGRQYLWCGDPEVWALKAPVLFPICGGLKDGKFVFEGKEYSLMKHGYGRFKNFEIESCHDDTAVFLHKSDDETKELYPFDYEFRIIYKLCGNELHVTYSTKNVSDKTMYFSVGAHEGYVCPEGIEEYEADVYEQYVERRKCLVDGLNKINGVYSPIPMGAFYTVASLPVEDADDFCAWCLSDFEYEGETIMMAPASGFYSTPGQGRNEVRIAYVLCKEDLQRALFILEKALEAYNNR